MKKECKIVQDLMPNYIEQLTSKESNEYIEEHIKDCKNCTKVFDAMKEDFKLKSETPKEEIDYMKKTKKKMRLSDRLALIVLLLIIVLLLVFWREAFSFICYSNICKKYLYWQDEAQKTGMYTVKTFNEYKTYAYCVPGKIVTEVYDIGKTECWKKAIVESDDFEGMDLMYSGVEYENGEKGLVAFYLQNGLITDLSEEHIPYQPYFSFKEKYSFGELISTFMDVRYITLSDDCYVIDLKYSDSKVYVDRKTGLIKMWGDTVYTVNVGSISEESIKFPDLDNEYIVMEDYDSPERVKDVPTRKISDCTVDAGTIVSYDFKVKPEEDGNLQGFMKTDEDNIMITKVKTLKTYKKLQEKWSGLRDLTDKDFEQYYAMIVIDKNPEKEIHYSNFVKPEDEYANMLIELKEEEASENYKYSANLIIIPNNIDTSASGTTIFAYKVDITNN